MNETDERIKIEGFTHLGMVMLGELGTAVWTCDACRLVTDEPVFHLTICPAVSR